MDKNFVQKSQNMTDLPLYTSPRIHRGTFLLMCEEALNGHDFGWFVVVLFYVPLNS